ncbi:MAG: hypothetical protein WC384_02470 [Prolixibacteraceae bacterium]|jgi:hypothetical protein
MKKIKAFIALIACLTGFVSCSEYTPGENSGQEKGLEIEEFQFPHDTLVKLTELEAGDILVKPNMNWFPGTAMVNGGRGFGHALLVIEGGKDTNAIDLLRKIRIFESQARHVPEDYELRSAKGYEEGSDFRFANITFGRQNEGVRYRLRFNLTPSQRDSIVRFVLSQDSDLSSWRAQKSLPKATSGEKNKTFQDKKIWYCSLLIWQAFYEIAGVDLDPNGGIMVYPNDLISSPYFDNDSINTQKRVRF